LEWGAYGCRSILLLKTFKKGCFRIGGEKEGGVESVLYLPVYNIFVSFSILAPPPLPPIVTDHSRHSPPIQHREEETRTPPPLAPIRERHSPREDTPPAISPRKVHYYNIYYMVQLLPGGWDHTVCFSE